MGQRTSFEDASDQDEQPALRDVSSDSTRTRPVNAFPPVTPVAVQLDHRTEVHFQDSEQPEQITEKAKKEMNGLQQTSDHQQPDAPPPDVVGEVSEVHGRRMQRARPVQAAENRRAAHAAPATSLKPPFPSDAPETQHEAPLVLRGPSEEEDTTLDWSRAISSAFALELQDVARLAVDNLAAVASEEAQLSADQEPEVPSGSDSLPRASLVDLPYRVPFDPCDVPDPLGPAGSRLSPAELGLHPLQRPVQWQTRNQNQLEGASNEDPMHEKMRRLAQERLEKLLTQPLDSDSQCAMPRDLRESELPQHPVVTLSHFSDFSVDVNVIEAGTEEEDEVPAETHAARILPHQVRPSKGCRPQDVLAACHE